MKKILLFAAMVLVLFSCDGKSPAGDTAASEKITEAAEPEDGKISIINERSKVPDNIAEEDMGGMKFRLITRSQHEEEFFIEEETGELVEDAIYLRNIKIEDRFNIKFVPVTAGYDNTSATVAKSVKSGDDAYDLVADNMTFVAATALTGSFLDYTGIDTVDLGRDWFLQDAVKEMSVNNRLFSLPGEACLTILEASYCYYFNKALIADLGLENPYGLVLDGKWTLDKFAGMIKGLYRDLDGDGKKSASDFYGFSAFNVSHPVAYTYASGMRITKRNPSGIPEFVVPSERLYSNFEKVFALHCNNPDTFGAKLEEQAQAIELFRNRQAVFVTETINLAKRLRDMEDDFGIVPFPKYDEEQERYYTYSDGYASMMAVPITVRDPERVGKIISALNAESWKTIIPQYYDVAIKLKFVRDDESVQVLDALLDGRVFDFGYVYDDRKGYAFYMWDLISVNNPNVASHFEKVQRSAERQLEKTINFFLDY